MQRTLIGFSKALIRLLYGSIKALLKVRVFYFSFSSLSMASLAPVLVGSSARAFL